MLETQNKNELAAKAAPDQPSISDGLNPLRQLCETESPNSDQLLEGLIFWAQEHFGSNELVRAQEEFHRDFGKVFYEDPVYEARSTYFLDHFVLERPLSPDCRKNFAFYQTPIDLFLSDAVQSELNLAHHLSDRFRELRDFEHSAFQVRKARANTLDVQDIFSLKRLTIHAKKGQIFNGLRKTDIFQGFVLRFRDQNTLSNGLIVHPIRAVRTIAKFARKVRKSETFNRKLALKRLAHQQIRYLRHQHVDPRVIYLADPPAI